MMHDERLLEIIDPPEETEMLKCFGDACHTCKSFIYCPMHGGDDA